MTTKINVDPLTGAFKCTVRNINFRDITTPSVVLFEPFQNGGVSKQLLINRVTTRSRTITGTVTTAPQVKITDGTNDIVAAAAIMPTTAGRVAAATVITGRLVSNAAPLTLTKTVAAAGGTAFLGDIIIQGVLLQD